MRDQLRFSNIIVLGNWGVGKTQFIAHLSSMLGQEAGIRRTNVISDRHYFEEAVRADVQGRRPESDGSIRGAHSIMVKDGPRGQMVFRALDGLIFNEAHRQMLASLRQTEPGVVCLVEYATGPNAKFEEGELLDQSAHFVAEQLITSGALINTLVVELRAPFDLRERRNAVRADRVDEAAFQLYGQPGGNMTDEDAQRLGGHFLGIDNHIHGLESLAMTVFGEHIQTRLLHEGEASTLQRGRR